MIVIERTERVEIDNAPANIASLLNLLKIIPSGDAPESPVAQPAPATTNTAARFVKVGADGKDLPEDATDHVAVRDNDTNLLWSAGNVSAERLNHADATAACSKLALAGLGEWRLGEWRLPTVRELQSIVDFDRHEPAIDTRFFACNPNYYWSSTPVASSPDCAWIVRFASGYSCHNPRSSNAFVRAVRAVPGQ